MILANADCSLEAQIAGLLAQLWPLWGLLLHWLLARRVQGPFLIMFQYVIIWSVADECCETLLARRMSSGLERMHEWPCFEYHV